MTRRFETHQNLPSTGIDSFARYFDVPDLNVFRGRTYSMEGSNNHSKRFNNAHLKQFRDNEQRLRESITESMQEQKVRWQVFLCHLKSTQLTC